MRRKRNERMIVKRLFLLLVAAALLLPFCAAGAETYIGADAPAGWNARLRLTVFRTSDSDCMLVESGGEAMLVDGGFGRYGKPMYEKLGQLGIDKLHYVFITHPHDDHVQGLYDLFEGGMPVGQVFSIFPRDFDAFWYKSVICAAERQGGVFKMLENGEVFSVGEAKATVGFWPMEKVRCWDSNAVNGHSALLRLEIGGCAALLTADIHSAAQQYMLEHAEPSYLEADILKVPHHGRVPMEKAFIEAVAPDLLFCNNKLENTKPLENQAKGLKLPLLYSGAGTITMETDGADWYIWQSNSF